MSTRGHVVAVTCLALEARIALGPGVAVICNHASELVAALEAAAKRGAAGIISFGIAGGLAPDLSAGDWVVGSGVRTEQGHFQPIVAGHAHCSRCFPAPSTRRSSERTPRLRSPRKSVGFTCERVPSPSTPNHTLRPGSPPRTGFHLPPAAQSSIRPTACFRRRRCTDCATTAQRTSWRYYARLCGSPASFPRSPAPPSTHGPRRRRCGAAAGYWARDWVSRISASLCSTAAWRSRWAEPSFLCKTSLALPCRDVGGVKA